MRTQESGPDFDDLFGAVMEMLVAHDDVVLLGPGGPSRSLRPPRCDTPVSSPRPPAGLSAGFTSSMYEGTVLSALQETPAACRCWSGYGIGHEDGDAAACVSVPLPDAPVPANLIVPRGWLLTAAGIQREQDDEGQAGIWTPVLLYHSGG